MQGLMIVGYTVNQSLMLDLMEKMTVIQMFLQWRLVQLPEAT